METAAVKKVTSFRLSENLLNALKREAKKANRSLSNYVECVLAENVYREPNEETIAAIKEARVGEHAGKINMTNFNTFMKSINDIE